MKIVRESILNEEFIGNFISFNKKTNIEVYKNPKSLKKIKPDIRGISDLKGNLYIVDSPEIIHKRLIKYLQNVIHEIPLNTGWDEDKEFYVNLISWTRYKNTNIFALSESYIDINMFNDDEKQFINNYMEKVQDKNPQFTFKYQIIDELFGRHSSFSVK